MAGEGFAGPGASTVGPVTGEADLQEGEGAAEKVSGGGQPVSQPHYSHHAGD